MPSPENIRFYAAGYLGAAGVLATAGEVASASALLAEVERYMRQNTVDTPPPMIELLLRCKEDPVAHLSDIGAIEALFVHDANTMLEEAGVRIGSA